jgi:hypothetical protein
VRGADPTFPPALQSRLVVPGFAARRARSVGGHAREASARVAVVRVGSVRPRDMSQILGRVEQTREEKNEERSPRKNARV